MTNTSDSGSTKTTKATKASTSKSTGTSTEAQTKDPVFNDDGVRISNGLTFSDPNPVMRPSHLQDAATIEQAVANAKAADIPVEYPKNASSAEALAAGENIKANES